MSHTCHTNLILEHLTNDAFLISTNEHLILLDAFFTKKVGPFSSMPEDTMKAIFEGEGKFSDVDMVLGTHCHADHCSEEDLLKYKKDVTIILPQDAFASYDERPSQKMILTGSGIAFEDDDIRITAIETEHDGSGIVSPRDHVSYILESKPQDKCIVIMGDAETKPGLFDEWLKDRPVDALIINFVEAYQAKGRDFINAINPNVVILCHLPLPEDDKTHMGKLAIRNAERHKEELPPLVVCYEPGNVIEV